ncbi:MFS transporter [Gracilibacillus salinarum]|uniref:MFS transporter n=1 Tax=Gracilibacillus salinarum TaxID=2932255 RepID=A0ABY4GL11_9BACI|nr:MFS transporter [Gracilibacillus salinarum]UOQ84901.1 MFS transporter [Gracilibacillus salinarum]
MENKNMLSDKVPFHRRISYSLTDTGGNLLYCIITGYLLYFYTDVFGLSVGVAGTLLLLTRLIDAIDAPIWGFIIDHTKSKYGQSRPYFLWLCVPFAFFTVLTFTTPDLDGTWKIVYAAATYILAGICYTGISTPITAILPNLSRDPNERVILNSFRMVGGNIGNFAAVTFTLPLVAYFGGGNEQKGFTITVALAAVIAIIMFLIAFSDLREINTTKIKKLPMKQSIKAVKGNWPWVLVVAANLIFWIALTVRTSTLVYYFEYNIGDKGLVPLINGISVIQVLGMMVIPFIVKFSNKYTTTILGFALAAIGQVIMFTGGEVLSIIIIGWIIGNIGSGIACSMPFAMLSDTVDYGEWKTGLRASGFLTAIGSAFCIKAGSGLGGFIPSLILNAVGYVPNEVQTEASLLGIQFIFIWLPAIIFALGVIPMIFYRPYEKQEDKIRQYLTANQTS